MVLSNQDIRRELQDGDLVVEREEDPLNIQPASIDLHIGSRYRIYQRTKLRGTTFNPREDSQEDYTVEYEFPEIDGEKRLLMPPYNGDPLQRFCLLPIQEYIELPDYLEAEIRGRSSFGRLGLKVHSTAGLVDPGWKGTLALEVSNDSAMPIELRPGDRVAQLVFNPLDSPADPHYGEKDDAKYQGQKGTQPSKSDDDRYE